MATLKGAEAKRRRKGERGVEFPLLSLYGTVIFPHMTLPLQIDRPKSLRAIEEALSHGRQIVVVSQIVSQDEELVVESRRIGTLATVGQVLRLPQGGQQVLIHGDARVRILEYTQREPSFRARVVPMDERTEKTVEVEALMRSLLDQVDRFAEITKAVPAEVIAALKNIEEPGRLADMVAFSPELTVEQRLQLLEELDPTERLKLASRFLAKQLELLEIRTKIHAEVEKGFEKIQRDHYLREQLRAIQEELGEDTPEAAVSKELRAKVEKAGMPEEVRKKALEEVERLQQLPQASPETAVLRTYLDWLVSLPWSAETEDHLDLKEAARILDEDHYGLRRVKERILEYMAVRKLSKEARSPILCFVGPPGVGKTSLGRSIARALGRKFVRISLGGIRDEAEIRGHRRTYVGALPGRIIQSMRNVGWRNPIFMLDEIDKIGQDFRGDPSAALLEVLDPEQNHAFSDHYLEVPFDLSRVIFIATANHIDPVPPALRDRLEVIELPGYTEAEKLEIARHFLVGRQLEQHGLEAAQLRFSAQALRSIAREHTREAGVRNLERELANICRKVARQVAEGRKGPVLVKPDSLPHYLGPPRFYFGAAQERDEVGVATGLYWTPTGGDLVTVEVNAVVGKAGLILTGQLGNVMQESARAALSFARSHSSDLGIRRGFFDSHLIHIHVPEGAIPKEGPSAGITMATALISAITGRPVRKEVAMTGEITLRGKVLPVGGIKEKLLAAHRAGIKTFVLPKKNRKDLAEVPAGVLRDLRLVLVERMEEVLEASLLKKEAAAAEKAA